MIVNLFVKKLSNTSGEVFSSGAGPSLRRNFEAAHDLNCELRIVDFESFLEFQSEISNPKYG